jgi:hypothetical protein
MPAPNRLRSERLQELNSSFDGKRIFVGASATRNAKSFPLPVDPSVLASSSRTLRLLKGSQINQDLPAVDRS